MDSKLFPHDSFTSIRKFLVILSTLLLIAYCSASVPDSFKVDSAKIISTPVTAMVKDSTVKDTLKAVAAIPVVPETVQKPIIKEETDLDVQRRMAVAGERSLIWMIVSGFLTLISVIIAIFSIKASTKQSERALRKELGSIEIDFEGNTKGMFTTAFEGASTKKATLHFSLIYTGTSMVRLISTTIDLVKCDFMRLPADWASKLKAHEEYSHSIILPGKPLEYEMDTDKFPINEWNEIVRPVEPPTIKCDPLCFLGRIKFQNGVGETWIKPFIFRFTWDSAQMPQVETWHVNCKPWKVYPTFRTDYYEWRMGNPKMGKFSLNFVPQKYH